MDSNAVPWWWLLGASVIVGEVLAFWLGYHWHKSRAARDAVPSVPAEILRQQIEEFDAALQGIDESLNHVDKSFDQLRQAEKDGSLRPDQQLRDQALRIAERLAARGSSRDDLVRICGITPGEADMIQRIHSPAKGSH
ncbi:MAG: hypothetical protein ACPG4N_09210 [Gammaproteobacteria bacterium]